MNPALKKGYWGAVILLCVFIMAGFPAPRIKKEVKRKFPKSLIKVEELRIKEEVPLEVIAKDRFFKALIRKGVAKKKGGARIEPRRAIPSYYYRPSIDPRVLSGMERRKTIRVTVFADDTDYSPPISDDDIEQTFEFASETLQSSTGWVYRVIDIQHGSYSALGSNASDYLQERSDGELELPDYIVFFAKDTDSLSYGGHTLGPFAFETVCNRAGSPYYPPGDVYGAVLDWHHLLGRCGYELEGDSYVHVSSTSSGGACRNQDGLECVFRYGEWQCPDLLEDPDFLPFLEDRRLFTAATINHELLHSFGPPGRSDTNHGCGPEVPPEIVELSAFNICGTTISSLSQASRSCAGDPRPPGLRCREDLECQSEQCYSFLPPSGRRTRSLCSQSCESDEDCSAVEFWRVSCLDREGSPVTEKGCYYE
ncbi:MAG: hypothetical protein HY539_04290 [Deltaproteobacteria bacterium]|nr:hypothetical protein [Deltaproteobacteria bacterium]